MSQIHLPRKVNIAFRFASGVPAMQAKSSVILVIATVHYTRVHKGADTRGRNDRILCTQFFLGIGSLGSSCWVWRSKSASAARECVPRGLIKALRCPILRWRESAPCAYALFCSILILSTWQFGYCIVPRYSLFLYHRVITQNYPR